MSPGAVEQLSKKVGLLTVPESSLQAAPVGRDGPHRQLRRALRRQPCGALLPPWLAPPAEPAPPSAVSAPALPAPASLCGSSSLPQATNVVRSATQLPDSRVEPRMGRTPPRLTDRAVASGPLPSRLCAFGARRRAHTPAARQLSRKAAHPRAVRPATARDAPDAARA